MPAKRTLTDILYPGKNANPRHAYLLSQYSAKKLSPHSREFGRLVTLGWVSRHTREITPAGKDVLRHYVPKK